MIVQAMFSIIRAEPRAYDDCMLSITNVCFACNEWKSKVTKQNRGFYFRIMRGALSFLNTNMRGHANTRVFGRHDTIYSYEAYVCGWHVAKLSGGQILFRSDRRSSSSSSSVSAPHSQLEQSARHCIRISLISSTRTTRSAQRYKTWNPMPVRRKVVGEKHAHMRCATYVRVSVEIPTNVWWKPRATQIVYIYRVDIKFGLGKYEKRIIGYWCYFG